jgi:hypothetical protein
MSLRGLEVGDALIDDRVSSERLRRVFRSLAVLRDEVLQRRQRVWLRSKDWGRCANEQAELALKLPKSGA